MLCVGAHGGTSSLEVPLPQEPRGQARPTSRRSRTGRQRLQSAAGRAPAHVTSFFPVSRSRTKNMMWYGVLGTKELLHRTYKNLEQKVLLEVSRTVGLRPSPAARAASGLLPALLPGAAQPLALAAAALVEKTS